MTDGEKQAIKDCDSIFICLDDFMSKESADDYRKSYLTLTNLIEKQSKEIEELKEERKKYPIAMNDEQYKKVIELAQKDIKEELDKQINVRMINEEYIERNYISKDQIKAKIEELENQKRQWVEDRDNKHKDSEIIYAIEVLQSLLEKE